MSDHDTIVVDPEIVLPPRPVATSPRVYFRVHDGGDCIVYTVVATDRAHAQAILRDSGNEWYDAAGEVCAFDAADLRWTEIGADRAAVIQVFEDDSTDGPHRPLNTYEPGAWFCSEC